MLKDIKIKREIIPLINSLTKYNSMGKSHMDYYKFDDDTLIQVNNYFLCKSILIHVERFPFYDKKVHTLVMNALNEYKNYDVRLLKRSDNRCVNVDEL